MDTVRTACPGRPAREGGTHSVKVTVSRRLYLELLDTCARNEISLSRFTERALELAVDLVKGCPSPMDRLDTYRADRVP